IRELARRSLRKHGLALVRYAPDEYPHLLRHRLLSEQGVELVLDVGANVGQYVDHLRGEGYTGRILSFEPAGDTFRELSARSAHDPSWEVRRLALGDRQGTVQLHKYAESAYNSALRGVDGAVPAPAGDEDVELTTLDALEGDAWTRGDRICLKVDVQGFETQVLTGARGLLARCSIVEVELSTVAMYEGQALFPEVAEMLYGVGMRMI